MTYSIINFLYELLHKILKNGSRQSLVPRPSSRNKILLITPKNYAKLNPSFLLLSNFAWFLYFVPLVFSVVLWVFTWALPQSHDNHWKACVKLITIITRYSIPLPLLFQKNETLKQKQERTIFLDHKSPKSVLILKKYIFLCNIPQEDINTRYPELLLAKFNQTALQKNWVRHQACFFEEENLQFWTIFSSTSLFGWPKDTNGMFQNFGCN